MNWMLIHLAFVCNGIKRSNAKPMHVNASGFRWQSGINECMNPLDLQIGFIFIHFLSFSDFSTADVFSGVIPIAAELSEQAAKQLCRFHGLGEAAEASDQTRPG